MRISNFLAIALFELKRVWNNKPFLVLVAIAPILSSIVFGFVAYKLPENMHTTVFIDRPQVSTVATDIQQIINEIDGYRRTDGSKPFYVVIEQSSREAAIQRLDEGKTRAVIIFKQGETGLEDIELVMDITETEVSNELNQVLLKILSQYSKETSIRQLSEFLVAEKGLDLETAGKQAKQIVVPFDTYIGTSAWKELRYFDFYASPMIMILTLGISLLFSLITITSERTRGTIERIFVSPYSRAEIIAGKLLAFSIFAVIVAVLVIFTLKVVFNMALGNVGLVLLIASLVGINGVVFGILISSMTYTEAESIFAGMLCLFAMMGLMTYIVPWETMHITVETVSKILPYTYGIQAIRHVNMTNATIQDVWPALVILVAGIIVQMGIAIPVLRREIK